MTAAAVGREESIAGVWWRDDAPGKTRAPRGQAGGPFWWLVAATAIHRGDRRKPGGLPLSESGTESYVKAGRSVPNASKITASRTVSVISEGFVAVEIFRRASVFA